jgi:hypothetical protein
MENALTDKRFFILKRVPVSRNKVKIPVSHFHMATIHDRYGEQIFQWIFHLVPACEIVKSVPVGGVSLA